VQRVLSIDGGGVRGLVAALVLAELEDRAGRPIAALFDLVAGTSTGALLGLALLRPGANGSPHWSARDLATQYETRAPFIFDRSAWRVLRTVNGSLAPKYPSSHLERELRSQLGETMFSHALRDVIVTSYDLRSRRPFFFKTADVRAGRSQDLPMRVVARCSAAAPTYFSPGRVRDGTGTRRLVDGGVYANNPAMCAFADVRKAHRDAPVLLVSVGTGSLSTNLATPRMAGAGSLGWARPLFDIVLDGQEDATDYQLDKLLGRSYRRLQADLDDRSEPIDATSVSNLDLLRQSAARLIDRHSAQLDEIAATLAES
jgi:patatin-like phospholipase/acyl hydrolase